MSQLTEYDVKAINLRRKQAMLNTGAIVAIDKYFDADGDETNDPAEAQSFTVQFPDGIWGADAVDSYNATRH